MIPDDELEARVRRDARALAERPLPGELHARMLATVRPAPRRQRRLTWQFGVAGVTALALATALVAGLVLHGRTPSSTPATHPAWHQVFRVPVNGGPSAALGAGGGSAWTSTRAHTQLYRVDSATGVATLISHPSGVLGGSGGATLAGRRSSALVTAQGIWVATDNLLLRIDSVSGQTVTTLAISGVGPDHGVIEDSTGIWAASGDKQAVVRVDPHNFTIVATVPVLSQSPPQSADTAGDPDSVAALDGLIWAAGNDSESLAAIDPASNEVTRTLLLTHPESDMVAAAGSLWIASASSGIVDRIDPTTGAVLASVPIAEPVSLSAGGDAVWVASSSAGEVVRIDTATNAISDRVTVGMPAFAVAVDGRDVWAASGQDSGISLIRQG